jgi:hypothetical protein
VAGWKKQDTIGTMKTHDRGNTMGDPHGDPIQGSFSVLAPRRRRRFRSLDPTLL